MKKHTTNQGTQRKTSQQTATPEWTVGVDIGDTHSQLCVLDAAGEVVEEGRIQTTRDAFERRFTGAPKARVVIETGGHSRWIDEVVAGAGHDVVVANARELPKISRNIRKSDRNDAELLARLGRSDPKLLSPVQHRSAGAQRGLSLIRARAAMVKGRTSLVCCVRGIVKSAGARMPRCDADDFYIHKDKLPAGLQDALAPLVEQIRLLTDAIAAYDELLKTGMDTLAPGARNLTTIPGVGVVHSKPHPLASTAAHLPPPAPSAASRPSQGRCCARLAALSSHVSQRSRAPIPSSASCRRPGPSQPLLPADLYATQLQQVDEPVALTELARHPDAQQHTLRTQRRVTWRQDTVAALSFHAATRVPSRVAHRGSVLGRENHVDFRTGAYAISSHAMVIRAGILWWTLHIVARCRAK